MEAEHIRTPVTLVSTDPDFLAPRWQLEELAGRMGSLHRLIRVSSLHGHDAFLTDEGLFSSIIRDFIAGCDVGGRQGS
ncbi:Homoserine O-acetyltransferase [compost metagenome]